MNISVIFPTYQRANDLRISLDSLLQQTQLPYETIIVDQSEDNLTKDLCIEDKYKLLNIIYIRSDCKSPPIAKQIGMEHLSQDSNIMLFLDDDIKLDQYYLEEVIKFMRKNPNALGGGGNILNLPHKKSFIEDLGYLLFRNIYISHEFCTPDAQYSNPDKIQNVLSIIGCNMFYRSSLSKRYSFVNRMKRYGHADDTFFSYQISNNHPNSLFYLPDAKLYHYESKTGRIAKIEKFRQILLHRYIFWLVYKFSLITYLRWSFGFLIWYGLQFSNKRQLIKEWFKTIIRGIKNQDQLKKKPIIVNNFIY